MHRMTSEEAYREYRKLEVYDADEVDREIKRLLEAFQRERDEKESCVRHSEKIIERLREALDAAEKAGWSGSAVRRRNRLEELCGANPTWADEMALLRDALAEYDKLKEVE